MHLGFLTSEYPHVRCKHWGGIGTSIKNLAEALVRKGVQVSVFIYNQEEAAVFSEAGIKFHFIKKQHYRFLGWYLYRKHLQKYLNNCIKTDKIQAIEAADWTGITAFMNLDAALVIRFHGSDAYFCSLENRPQKKKNFFFEKTALQGADYLLSVSEFTAQETSKIFGLQKSIKVIPNSVDVEQFVPQNLYMVPNSILYFGTIIRKKGVLELAKIFNQVWSQNPKSQLFIAGKDIVDIKTGKSTKALMNAIFLEEALKNVHWLGSLAYTDVLEQIAKANVVVLPSFAEALPMTWLEAMAMEKALVTSNIGWAKEVMINGKTGFTEDPKNTLAYAQKITALLNEPDLAKKMGINARKQVLEKFSTEVVTQQNMAFYKQITS